MDFSILTEMSMKKESIQILVSLKHIGNITKKVKAHPFLLEHTPETLRELIEESVKSCIQAYKNRASNTPSPLSEEEFDSMKEVGKFAFGVHYNENAVDEEKAVQTALEAAKDGLVRIFNENKELTDFNENITVSEGDVFTFVKLTMLSGTMW